MGKLYCFGGGEMGQLGIVETKRDGDVVPIARYVPSCVELLSDQHIVGVSCGSFHTAAVTAVGDVFTFGWNKFGQLGLGHTDSIARPSLVTALSGMDVSIVSCSGDYTIAVTDHFITVQQNYFADDEPTSAATAAAHSHA